MSMIFSAGTSGSTGPTGAPGIAGATGATGAPMYGVTGSIGAAGAAGASGPAGSTGPAGSSGAVGAVGPAGAPGAPGTSGPSGSAGPDGGDGPQGATGPQGDQGGQGASGVDQLAPGPTGATGAQGPHGTDTQVTLLTNPGFRYVQLFDPTIANAATDNGVTADAWKTPFENAGLEFQRLSNIGTADWKSAFRLKLTKKTNAGKIMIYQALENMLTRELAGKSLAFRFRLKTSVPRGMTFFMIKYDGVADTIPDPVAIWNGDNVVPTLSANFSVTTTGYPHPLTGTYSFFTSGTVEVWNERLYVYAPFEGANNLLWGLYSETKFAVGDYLELAEAGLYSGRQQPGYAGVGDPSNWCPLSSEEDLKRVERFIEKTYAPDTVPQTITDLGVHGSGLEAAGLIHHEPVHFRRGKPKLPTISLISPAVNVPMVGNWWLPGVPGPIAVTVANPGLNNFTVVVPANAASPQPLQGHFLADASL